MKGMNPRKIVGVAAGTALVGLLVWLLRPSPLLVEAAPVARGPLRATVSAEGRTRVKSLFTVTAPVDGELERILLEPGDSLTDETVIARIRPVASRPLDARSRSEAAATVVAAREAAARAEAVEREAAVGVEHTQSKLTRTQALARSNSVPQAELEHGGHEVLMAKQRHESAQAAVRQARAELARATAIVAPPSGTGSVPVVEVKSPASGQVLRVLRESAGPVAAGTPLLEVGDVSNLEVVADVLSSDAATVRVGASAGVSGWGGSEAIVARVRRVDPAGFTKVSALGLEEQRVRVVLDFGAPPPRGLGHDYRVEVSIVVWEASDVVRISSTALFREGDRWATFVIEDGRARMRTVETGPSDAAMTVVKGGARPGEKVIPQPSDTISDGVRVEILRELPH
jgi:HlyD family secretion protein